jgi:hypothetical protein
MSSITGQSISGVPGARRTWAGQGTNQPCSVCGRLIRPQEIEYEVELASGKILHFHFACQQVWEDQNQPSATAG